MRQDAKMMAITPAAFTLSGRYVVWPPMTRRPCTRFAYDTGMRRCARSMNTMAGMQATTMTRMSTVMAMPRPLSAVEVSDWKIADGTRATMDVKMMSDMPLPMPRCVMSSPIHMMQAVPATSVKTTRMSVSSVGTSSLKTTPYCGDWNRNR